MTPAEAKAAGLILPKFMEEQLAAEGAQGAKPPKAKDKRLANLGDAWEAMLKVQHEQYRALGVADLDKTEPPAMQLSPMRTERKRPVFTASWGVNRQADFVGGVSVGRQPGRLVRLEAKSARESRVTLFQSINAEGRSSGAGLQDNQVASLTRTLNVGGFAAVLVLIPAGMWLVPFENWHPPAGEPNRKSLSPEHLEAQGVRFGSAAHAERVLLGLSAPADWLGAAVRKGWL